jgi:hypothetical protein
MCQEILQEKLVHRLPAFTNVQVNILLSVTNYKHVVHGTVYSPLYAALQFEV